MYLKRFDFETYGFTDGCPGCRDISIGRSGPSSAWAAHTRACRKRLEEAIQLAEPARWDRHLRRRREGEAEEAAPPAPAVDAEDDDARSSHGDPDEGLFGHDGPLGRESASVLRGSSADPRSRSAQHSEIPFERNGGDSGQGEVDRTSGAASGPGGRDSEPSSLVQRLCAIDVCEVFSPPRVGK